MEIKFWLENHTSYTWKVVHIKFFLRLTFSTRNRKNFYEGTCCSFRILMRLETLKPSIFFFFFLVLIRSVRAVPFPFLPTGWPFGKVQFIIIGLFFQGRLVEGLLLSRKTFLFPKTDNLSTVKSVKYLGNIFHLTYPCNIQLKRFRVSPLFGKASNFSLKT